MDSQLLNKHETDIVELKTRIDYKHQRLDEMKESIDELGRKIDKIDRCLSKLQRQSERDDFNIDHRVTTIESAIKVLKWVVAIGLTAIGTGIAVLAFIITIMH